MATTVMKGVNEACVLSCMLHTITHTDMHSTVYHGLDLSPLHLSMGFIWKTGHISNPEILETLAPTPIHIIL